MPYQILKICFLYETICYNIQFSLKSVSGMLDTTISDFRLNRSVWVALKSQLTG